MSKIESHYEPETSGPEVKFTLTGVQPPSTLYVTREDQLILTSFSSLTGMIVELRGRMMLPNGSVVPFIYSHVPNSNRTANTTVHPIPEGFLLDAFVALTGNSARVGQLLVMLSLGRGTPSTPVSFQMLVRGYLANFESLSWPHDRLHSPMEGQGVIRLIVGTQPAAGAEISEAVPTGARWRLLALSAQLNPSATVATRQASLFLDDGANVFMRSATPDTTVASTAKVFNWAEGSPIAAVVQTNNTEAVLGVNNRLEAGWRIRTSTTNLQVGDQWSAPNYVVEEWIEP